MQAVAKAEAQGGALLGPSDALVTLRTLRDAGIEVACTMLDPWYNKGIGGERDDYVDFIAELLDHAGAISQHVYLWGFPEIVATLVPVVPESLEITAWLTWYYKNSPSVIRGWRSSQQTCLHLSRPGARLYPEHFMNEAQLEKQREGKLRYMPGPTSVIDVPLLVGFCGRNEQVGHKAQKPLAVIRPLIEMATVPGDLVVDPMCGSGTTGVACLELGRPCLLADIEPDYVSMTAQRLGIKPGRRLGGRSGAVQAVREAG